MHHHSTYDRFVHNCENSTFSRYPWTQLRGPRPHEYQQWEAYFTRFQDNDEESLLFKVSKPKIEFWETGSTNHFTSHVKINTNEIRHHLRRGENDPMIRHVFLQSDDSRSPLNCSSDMLKFISTYQQIDPFFLDCVSAFAEQEEPKDQCFMSFRGVDTLACADERMIKLPQLGRSGREINISYLLRSVEFREDGGWKWSIRQAAVYHSFDVETGRSFWFTIKGNDLFNKRIKKSSECLDIPSRSSDDTASYFEASLLTHLVYLAWCDENWRGFNNAVENGIREILNKARITPIDDHLDDHPVQNGTYPRPLRGDSRVSSFHPQRTNSFPNNPLRKQSTFERMVGASQKIIGSVRTIRSRGEPDIENGADTIEEADHESIQSSEGIDIKRTLDKFRIKDAQTLRTFGERIQKAVLTLQLNIDVLESMYQYYSKIFTTDVESVRELKQQSEYSLALFLSEVQSISKRLQSRKHQLECLAVELKDGNQLYGDILQYRSLHIGQLFMESAQETAKQTKIIAEKTAVKTTSMHVITFVTLIFLPATFVAVRTTFLLHPHGARLNRSSDLTNSQTFFQSGVFLWSDDATRYIPFLAICLPLTALTLGAWLFVFLKMRGKMMRAIRPIPQAVERGLKRTALKLNDIFRPDQEHGSLPHNEK